MLTKQARSQGHTCERWNKSNYDLSTEVGFQQARRRLIELRPHKLWVSPECAPFSRMQNLHPSRNLDEKQALGKRVWKNCMRLCLAQQQLGGQFYIEQPWTCGTWKLTDKLTKSVLENSTYCRRDQCVDGLINPENKLPMEKGTRIQSNDSYFCTQFAQRCKGHGEDYHTPIIGRLARDTAFYPKPFCNRILNIWTRKKNVKSDVIQFVYNLMEKLNRLTTPTPMEKT